MPILPLPRIVRGNRRIGSVFVTTQANITTTLWERMSGRGVVLRKLMVSNLNGAAATLQIGETTTGGFVQRLPLITIAATDNTYMTEEQLPEYIFYRDIEYLASAANIEMLFEVEEIT